MLVSRKVVEAVADTVVVDGLELEAVVAVVQNTTGFLLVEESKVD